MYQARDSSDLSPLALALAERGIAFIPDTYSVNELAELNAMMSPLFHAKRGESRSYVKPDEMVELGIFDKVLSENMKDVLFSIVPDPVLYHLHAYEIAGQSQQSHIFSDQLGGWHRDPDSEYFPGDPTHASVFVYLTNVGEDGGAFEFSPQRPDKALQSGSPAVTMVGPAGMSFVWQRSFYHRAAPNRASRRRRVLKISIQRNEFISAHLASDFFRHAIARVPSGDGRLDLLLGRFQRRRAPEFRPTSMIRPKAVEVTKAIDIANDILEQMARDAERPLAGPVAYD
jgi:hypothetical protein